MSASLQSNIEIVKAHRRDRYIATLFAPQNIREDLFVLYAFDAEVSRIRAVISDPLPGEIRLQWWREVINGERAGEAKGNALAHDITNLIMRHSLPRAAFEAYFDAKIFEFYNDVFPDTIALEAWCGETTSAIIQMAAKILDESAAKTCSDTSGHGGVVLGIANSVQRLAYTRARRQCYVPRDILNACGLEPEAYFGNENQAAIKNATDALCALGLSHFEKFKTATSALPLALKPAFLPVVSASSLLIKAAKPNVKPAFETIEMSVMRTLFAISKAAIF